MVKRAFLFCVLIICLAGPFQAQAGVISLQTSVIPTIKGGEVLVRVNLTNKGSDAAHTLQVSATLLDSKAKAPGPEMLSPNQSATVNLTMPFTAVLPGAYTVLVMVRFQDANQHPFSSLAWGVLNFEKRPLAQITLKGEPATIENQGEVTLKLANLMDRELKIDLGLHAPLELTIPQNKFDIALAGRSKQHIEFPVENFTALNGASYPILALAQWEDGGLHHTATASMLLKIKVTKDPLAKYRPYLYAGGAALLLLFIILEIVRRQRKKGSRPHGKAGH